MSIPRSAYAPINGIGLIPIPEYHTKPKLTGQVDNPRCSSCNRRLAEYLTAPFSIRCPRCGTSNVIQ